MPPATVLSWWRGHPAGWWNPLDYNIASVCVPIGTHVPHAAGLAWGKKLRGESPCAIAYFGDGATSEGSFHEGANFAAVMRAPLVLFCNNNQWAISTPLSAQTAAETLADKAVGYGMPGVRVDGCDVLAVFEATREAVARARAGEGPTFIEAVTYRAAPHATADDPSVYIDPERVEEERRRECVGRFEGYLRRRGLLPDELAEPIREVAAQLRDAVRRLQLSVPRPADQPRRPLPLAVGRGDGVPDHRPHAVRRRRARPGAARRLARDLLRAHARREGGDPGHSRRRQGP